MKVWCLSPLTSSLDFSLLNNEHVTYLTANLTGYAAIESLNTVEMRLNDLLNILI